MGSPAGLGTGSQPGSLATFDNYILGNSQPSNGSAVECVAQAALASRRRGGSVLLGMEQDALCALAGYEAGAERTQPWPWTVDRSPAEEVNARATHSSVLTLTR